AVIGDALCQLAGFGQDGFFVDGGEAAVAHEDFAVDDGGGDVLAADGVDEMGIDVVEGREVGGVEVDDDQVGELAGLKGAEAGFLADGSGGAGGDHADHVLGGQESGVLVDAFVQGGGEAHGGPEVEVVAADRAVGADAEFDAGAGHAGDGGDAGAELE